MQASVLNREEKEKRIAAGAAIRKKREEKRKLILENKKALQKGLSIDPKKVQNVSQHLYEVVYHGQALNLEIIPQVVDVFKFKDTREALVAYRRCRDTYDKLIGRCWYFEAGKSSQMQQSAFEFWNGILSRPEAKASSSLVLNILASGQINTPLFKILKEHREKFVSSGMTAVITNACERMLREKGHTNLFADGGLKDWTEHQRQILGGIVDLFKEAK